MRKTHYDKNDIIMALLIVVALILAVFTGVRLFTGKRHAQAKATAKATAAPTIVVVTPQPQQDAAEGTDGSEANTGPKANAGGFMTQTGTSLNLIVNWYAEEAGDEVSIYIDVLLDCYTLQTGSRNEGITIGVGSKTFVYDSAPVTETTPGADTVLLHATHIYVPASDFVSGQCPIYATWNFGGSYGGQPIPELTAQGTITLE